MNIEEVRETALQLPHATERSPFGLDTLAIEIGGKMFCLFDLSAGGWDFYNLKSTRHMPKNFASAMPPSVPAIT